MIDEAQRKKLGDVICDVGKYMLTVIPFSYFLSDRPSMVYVVISAAVFGVLLTILGLYFVGSVNSKKNGSTKNKRKIRIMKNTVLWVEEEA